MRRLIFVFLILIVTMSIFWIFAGRQVSMFVDRFQTADLQSVRVNEIGYEGSGDGGTLIVDGTRLNLSPLNPHVGSTKDDQLALVYAGNIFPFGPLRAADVEKLIGNVPEGEAPFLETRASFIVWPSFNSTGLHLKQNNYYRLYWRKPGGMKLEMSWSVDLPQKATSLIRIEITNAAR
jgi:hypothetical protein